MTDRERAQKRRDKIKSDPMLRIHHLQREAERQRAFRAKRTPLQAIHDKQQSAVRMRKSRERSASLAETAQTVCKTGSAILNAYASKRAFTKAVSRTRKNLPVSRRIASVVINELAFEYGITTKRAKISSSQLPQSTVMAVKDFYCRGRHRGDVTMSQLEMNKV